MASGPAGLLPPHNPQQTEGQELLYSINNRDYSELFVAYECLRSGTDNLKVLVSNERVIVISGGSKGIVTEVSLADLLYCQPTHRLESNGMTLHYIELTSRADSVGTMNFDGPEILRRPKVRCDSEDIAKWVSLMCYLNCFDWCAGPNGIIINIGFPTNQLCQGNARRTTSDTYVL